MDVEITPEPGPRERAAIELALRRIARPALPPAYTSAWRKAGLPEPAEVEENYAVARPRRSFGAIRA
jgi:hypothetical protein